MWLINSPDGDDTLSTGSMEAVFNLLSDGILIIRDDRSIAYANSAFMTLWRVPQDLVNFRNDFALINHVLSQLAEPTAFVSVVESLYCSAEESHDELTFKDGRLFARHSVPLNPQGLHPARVWIFSDITHARNEHRELGQSAKKPGLLGNSFKH